MKRNQIHSIRDVPAFERVTESRVKLIVRNYSRTYFFFFFVLFRVSHAPATEFLELGSLLIATVVLFLFYHIFRVCLSNVSTKWEERGDGTRPNMFVSMRLWNCCRTVLANVYLYIASQSLFQTIETWLEKRLHRKQGEKTKAKHKQAVWCSIKSFAQNNNRPRRIEKYVFMLNGHLHLMNDRCVALAR